MNSALLDSLFRSNMVATESPMLRRRLEKLKDQYTFVDSYLSGQTAYARSTELLDESKQLLFQTIQSACSYLRTLRRSVEPIITETLVSLSLADNMPSVAVLTALRPMQQYVSFAYPVCFRLQALDVRMDPEPSYKALYTIIDDTLRPAITARHALGGGEWPDLCTALLTPLARRIVYLISRGEPMGGEATVGRMILRGHVPKCLEDTVEAIQSTARNSKLAAFDSPPPDLDPRTADLTNAILKGHISQHMADMHVRLSRETVGRLLKLGLRAHLELMAAILLPCDPSIRDAIYSAYAGYVRFEGGRSSDPESMIRCDANLQLTNRIHEILVKSGSSKLALDSIRRNATRPESIMTQENPLADFCRVKLTENGVEAVYNLPDPFGLVFSSACQSELVRRGRRLEHMRLHQALLCRASTSLGRLPTRLDLEAPLSQLPTLSELRRDVHATSLVLSSLLGAIDAAIVRHARELFIDLESVTMSEITSRFDQFISDLQCDTMSYPANLKNHFDPLERAVSTLSVNLCRMVRWCELYHAEGWYRGDSSEGLRASVASAVREWRSGLLLLRQNVRMFIAWVHGGGGGDVGLDAVGGLAMSRFFG